MMPWQQTTNTMATDANAVATCDVATAAHDNTMAVDTVFTPKTLNGNKNIATMNY